MKKIGIGYENYKEFIEQDLYYMDKTLLVRDVLHKGGKVTLLTRPRRFGKTLGLSMLRTFFELEYVRGGNVIDKRQYFEGMKIMEEGEEALGQERGKYANALQVLSTLLEMHHGKKAVILLDEYDVPMENACQEKFYPEMISFIRSLFESALKTNDVLEFAVITGCLSISREIVFSLMAGRFFAILYSLLSGLAPIVPNRFTRVPGSAAPYPRRSGAR